MVQEQVDRETGQGLDAPVADAATVTRQAYAAFGARDIPALLALLAPDVAWGQPDNPLIPSAGTRAGVEGVIEWLRIGNETEEVLALEPRRIVCDDEVAAVIGRTRIRVRRTGREYETDFVHLVTVRNGKVVRFQEFFDTFAAAEAFRE